MRFVRLKSAAVGRSLAFEEDEILNMGYEISWEPPNGVIKRHFGKVTGGEVLAANSKIEGDERFDTLRYVINDFLDCTELAVSPMEIVEIAAIDHAAAATNPDIRVAVVATHPDVVATASSYANDPLTTYTTRVFSSMSAARSWLGLLKA
jgi:hypothetical protein